MQTLNLPSFEYRLREGARGSAEIFDPLRKKFVKMTPEEWVRQHMLNYLTAHRGYPPSLIGVEVRLNYHSLKKRSDIVVFDRSGDPLLLVECKAPSVPVTRDVFYQVAMYNRSLAGKYLVLSNGLVHHACVVEPGNPGWRYLTEIPDFTHICPLPWNS